MNVLADPYWLGEIDDIKEPLSSLVHQSVHLAQKDAVLQELYEDVLARTRGKGKLEPKDIADMRRMMQSSEVMSLQCAAIQRALNTIADRMMPAILAAHLDAANVAPDEKKKIIASMLTLGEDSIHMHDNLLELVDAHKDMRPQTLTKDGEQRYTEDFRNCNTYLAQSAGKSIEQLLDPKTLGRLEKVLHTPAFARMFLLHCSLRGISDTISDLGETYRQFNQTLGGGMNRV